MDAKLSFINSSPQAEPLLDRDGTPIIKDGQQILHIPKSILDADLEIYFGIHNFGIDSVEHYQQGDILKCSVRCWYVVPTTKEIRYTCGSSGDHLTRIYNKFNDKGEAMAIMIPTLQTLAEKNAWAKLGKRFGRDLNKEAEKQIPASVPAQTLTPHETMVKGMLDQISKRADKLEALEKVNKQGIINTPFLTTYFNTIRHDS